MIPPSGLCVGLDIDLDRIPEYLRSRTDAVERFNERVIAATRHVAACYKVNLAFYERLGRRGIEALYATREMIGDAYVIMDAKRGDIGNTSAAYATALFDDLRADAVTVAPYMGRDSVEPFLAVPNSMTYVLALTSNPGSNDFQRLTIDGEPLYQRVMRTVLSWQRQGDVGFVVGATHADELAGLRSVFPDVPFLIPGIGTQGGDAAATVAANGNGPAVFNVSRGLLYISTATDFDHAIKAEAERLATQMRS
ncbi:MAG: orotidine-5'-phosphate decarboxylase [Candidatus Kapabacteria bacterium]|nr:orotidine-5'-phosphate decarboxylase [Candidatus Kapabacteria bacterium]